MALQYTSEEAEAILTRAVGRKAEQTVSHERLLAMADELGVSPNEVEAVIAEVLQEQQDKTFRREYIAQRRGTLWPHLVTYLLVCAFLILVNVLSDPHVIWAIFPILGWGIGIGSHAAAVLPTKGAAFEREFLQWKQQRERKTQRKARRASKKSQGEATSEKMAEETTVPTAVPRPTVTISEEHPQTLQQRAGH
jgi:hypothetical protein